MDQDWIAGENDLLLVTGANGFIGNRVVHVLLEYGFRNLRCFVRPTSSLGALMQVLDAHNATDTVEIVNGDLTSRADCQRAAAGARIVFHLAAGFDKSFAGAFVNSALATRNLIEALLGDGAIARFVNVSSFAVYSNLQMKRGQLLDEMTPLEDRAQDRFDPYGFGKLKQEEMVRHYARERGLDFVILRPGTVFGPGKRDLTGRIGIDTFGIFMHIGGRNVLPLTFVDNCAEAVVRAGLVPGVGGQVFNVVDDDLWTSKRFLAAYRTARPDFRSIRIPYVFAVLFSRAWEWYAKASKGQLPPAFNRRRAAAEWKGNRYSNQRLKQRVGWSPRVPMDQAMQKFVEQFAAGKLIQ